MKTTTTASASASALTLPLAKTASAVRRALLGSFQKGIPGSVALNFGLSAGPNCDPACSVRHICYAARLESHRPTVRANLTWKQDHLVPFLRELTTSQLGRIALAPWIRFSAMGSVPTSETLKANPGSRDLFRKLASHLDHSTVHFPVENLNKVLTYRALGYYPRLSLGENVHRIPQHLGKFELNLTQPLGDHTLEEIIRAPGSFRSIPIAITSPAPDHNPGWTSRSKDAARELARGLRLQYPDRTIGVCPAVLGRAKCGACKRCADPSFGGWDLVIYPEHP